MKDPGQRLVNIGEVAVAIVVLLILPAVIEAQSGNRNQPATPPGSPRPGDEQRPASIRERQFKMMEIEREAAQPPAPRDQKLAYAQIAEDYRELQTINNKMMSVAMPAVEPDFLRIAQTLSEIRKRAVRLKENLWFAESDLASSAKEKHKPAQNAAGLKSQLLALDDSIMRFVNSPIFRNPGVVDVKEAAKARADLEFIIDTSQLLSKDSERLNKPSTKTP